MIIPLSMIWGLSVVPRPSHVFQHYTRKMENAWLKTWAREQGYIWGLTYMIWCCKFLWLLLIIACSYCKYPQFCADAAPRAEGGYRGGGRRGKCDRNISHSCKEGNANLCAVHDSVKLTTLYQFWCCVHNNILLTTLYRFDVVHVSWRPCINFSEYVIFSTFTSFAPTIGCDGDCNH